VASREPTKPVQANLQASVTGVFGDVSHALRAEGFDASEDGTGRGTPIVAAFGGRCEGSRDVATTLSTKNQRNDFETETFVVSAFNSRQDPIVTGDKSGALSASSPQAEAVLSVAIRGRDGGSGIEIRSDSVASALRASQGGSDKAMVLALQAGVTRENPDSGPDGMGVRENLAYTMEARSEVQMVGGFSYGVRRLMPFECARLQGFPDDYLDIPYRGKPAADGPKYKALGNSMAVPVMRWIGERITSLSAKAEARIPER
jgi:DNA (cytosine-5)-methyltransferase 1